MRTCLGPLPRLKVSICRADHAQVSKAIISDVSTKSTSGFVPLKAGVFKNLVKAFGFSCAFNRARTRDTNRLNTGFHLATFQDLCRST